MVRYGFHASHEQFSPRNLLRLVQLAERNGFQVALSADHLAPWSERQGQSGFAWSWLGAALQATALPFGIVTSPVGRYNPAILAQAAATLDQMFPGRFWLAMGSGLAANEYPAGYDWPPKPARMKAVEEAAYVIRRLWTGAPVTHNGSFTLREARIYSLPEAPPPLFAAAITPGTAEWAAGWADGLITVAGPRDEMQKVIDAFQRGGGRNKPIFLQAQTAYAPTYDEALDDAYDQWRPNIFPSPVLTDIRYPADFDAAAALLKPEDMDGPIRVSADVDQHIRWLREDAEQGFDNVYIHNVGRDQDRFIRAFGDHVLPALKNEKESP